MCFGWHSFRFLLQSHILGSAAYYLSVASFFVLFFSEEQVQSTQAPQFDVGLVAGMSVFVIVLIVVIIVSLYYVR